MITVKLQGQMCNQMFQIAAAIGYSIKWDMLCKIPEKTQNPGLWSRAFPEIDSIANHTLTSALFNLKEPHNGRYLGDIAAPAKHVILDGYFQSHKYFEHCYKEIRETFNIPYKRQMGKVAIHVRRGDYLNLPDYHPVITKEYYQMAIRYYYQLGYREFRVFSDDTSWWLQNLPEDINPSFWYNQRTPLEDLQGISECDHLIGSNSSFSLMGYHLNPYSDKTCIFPRKWFGPALNHTDTTDMYPENAIKL